MRAHLGKIISHKNLFNIGLENIWSHEVKPPSLPKKRVRGVKKAVYHSNALYIGSILAHRELRGKEYNTLVDHYYACSLRYKFIFNSNIVCQYTYILCVSVTIIYNKKIPCLQIFNNFLNVFFIAKIFRGFFTLQFFEDFLRLTEELLGSSAQLEQQTFIKI